MYYRVVRPYSTGRSAGSMCGFSLRGAVGLLLTAAAASCCLRARFGWDNREIEVGCRLHNLDSMRVDSTQHTHRGACAGWGRSRDCSHQAIIRQVHSAVCAQRFGRLSGRGAGCCAWGSLSLHVSLRCARAPFGQRVREARIEGECASWRTFRLPCFDTRGRRGRQERSRRHRRGVVRGVFTPLL